MTRRHMTAARDADHQRRRSVDEHPGDPIPARASSIERVGARLSQTFQLARQRWT
jgi:hypothetical protein